MLSPLNDKDCCRTAPRTESSRWLSVTPLGLLFAIEISFSRDRSFKRTSKKSFNRDHKETSVKWFRSIYFTSLFVRPQFISSVTRFLNRFLEGLNSWENIGLTKCRFRVLYSVGTVCCHVPSRWHLLLGVESRWHRPLPSAKSLALTAGSRELVKPSNINGTQYPRMPEGFTR